MNKFRIIMFIILLTDANDNWIICLAFTISETISSHDSVSWLVLLTLVDFDFDTVVCVRNKIKFSPQIESEKERKRDS